MEGYQWGGGGGENGEKGIGIKKHKWQVLNRQWEVKNSTVNRETKELICTTHGHELRAGGGGMLAGGGCSAEGNKGEEKMGQLNSIINKIYLKKEKNKVQLRR